MPVPITLHSVEVRTPSFESPNKKDPSKPYLKIKALPSGADEFLTIGVPSPFQPGKFDMAVNMRTYSDGKNVMYFFDLVKAVPSA